MARDLPTLTLHELADGVFVWLQPGGESGVSNAGVVVDEDGLTVIDTLMVPDQWRPFAEAVQRLGLPVRRVVLTHAHIDHVGGTSAFRSAKVLASPLTSELLDQTMPLDAYKAFMPAFRDGFDELAAIGTRPVSHIVDDAAALTPRIEVLPASGHTAGDLVVLVDDAQLGPRIVGARATARLPGAVVERRVHRRADLGHAVAGGHAHAVGVQGRESHQHVVQRP